MEPGLESGEADVEDRILGEFMSRLQGADVDFYIVEEIEGLLDEDDFGGGDQIVENIEESVLDDADQ